jgi:uncharacterized RDD family membrane protein YckC
MKPEEGNLKLTRINQVAYRDKRVHNLAIDSLIIALIFYSVLSVVFSKSIFETRQFDLREYFSLYIITFLYYFLFELIFHKTPGKFFTKTKVVMNNGVPVDSFHILIRSLVRLIPIEHLSFVGSYPVGWHDRLSDTIVIDLNPDDKLPGFIEIVIKAMKILLYMVIFLAILLLVIGIGILVYRYIR